MGSKVKKVSKPDYISSLVQTYRELFEDQQVTIEAIKKELIDIKREFRLHIGSAVDRPFMTHHDLEDCLDELGSKLAEDWYDQNIGKPIPEESTWHKIKRWYNEWENG